MSVYAVRVLTPSHRHRIVDSYREGKHNAPSIEVKVIGIHAYMRYVAGRSKVGVCSPWVHDQSVLPRVKFIPLVGG